MKARFPGGPGTVLRDLYEPASALARAALEQLAAYQGELTGH